MKIYFKWIIGINGKWKIIKDLDKNIENLYDLEPGKGLICNTKVWSVKKNTDKLNICLQKILLREWKCKLQTWEKILQILYRQSTYI